MTWCPVPGTFSEANIKLLQNIMRKRSSYQYVFAKIIHVEVMRRNFVSSQLHWIFKKLGKIRYFVIRRVFFHKTRKPYLGLNDSLLGSQQLFFDRPVFSSSSRTLEIISI